MHVILDARWIFPEISGIGEYTRQLLRQMPRLASDVKFSVLFSDHNLRERTLKEAGIAETPNVQIVMTKEGLFSLRNQFHLPLLLRKLNADVFHSPNYMIPLAAFPAGRRGKCGCVVTIHDMIPFLFPDHAPKAKKTRMFPLYKALMRSIALRADRIITVSERSRSDVVECLNVTDNRKVLKIYNGVSSRVENVADNKAWGSGINDGQPKFTALYVGRSDPYKNLPTLIKAVAMIVQQSPGRLSLVIAGTPDPRYPAAVDLVKKSGLENCVKWTGYLHDEALAQVYAAADFLVQPSSYEGFGLQVLEAMQAGLPVIAARGGALPEVCGEAAIMVNPGDVQELSEAMQMLMNTPSEAARLRQSGWRNIKRFNWRKTAEETLAVYRELAEQ